VLCVDELVHTQNEKQQSDPVVEAVARGAV